jgi:iron complex outermembrane recepter protein
MKKLVFIGIILPFCATFAQAQTTKIDTLRTDSLREVAIISPYWANEGTPVTAVTLTRAELLAASTHQEPTFALANLPSMTVTSESGSYTGYSYVQLRGIDQKRLNLTLNGVPLNEPEDQGLYFANFPDFMQSIESVQIQRGVGTSKNGAASYAGSIGFETKRLAAEREGNVYAGFGSFNSYTAGANYNTGLHKGWGLYAQAGYVHSDNYKLHSANTGASAMVSAGYFGKRNAVKLVVLAGNQRNDGLAWLGVTDSIIKLNPRANGNSASEVDNFSQLHTQLHYTHLFSEKTTLNACLYNNAAAGRYSFDYNNYLGLPSNAVDLYYYYSNGNYVGAFANITHNVGAWSMNGGLHTNSYQRQHIGSTPAVERLYENIGYKREASAFTKVAYHYKKLRLQAELQYRTADFRYQGSVALPTLQWASVNPSFGVLYGLSPNADLYYNIGKTSREASRNDIFGGNDDLAADANGNAQYNNIVPETVVDNELGLHYRTAAFQLAANVYAMNFRNEIVLNGAVGPTGLALHSNAAQSLRSGIEISAAYRFGNGFSLSNNSSYSYHRISEGAVVLQPVLSPTLLLNQNIAYQIKNFGLTFAVRYQGTSYLDYANTTQLPAFLVFNVQANYTYKHLTANIQVRNLTNQRYFSSGDLGGNGQPSYFVQAPLNVWAGLNYRF